MKTTLKLGLILIGLALVASCKSKQKLADQSQLEVMMPASVAGTTVPVDSIERLRNPENLKCYYVNRYIDPNNSDVMYDKTTLYRIEESSSWNLRPNAEVNLPIGQETRRFAPNVMKPLISEFKKELHTQKEFSKNLSRANKMSSDIVRQTHSFIAQSKKEQKKLMQSEGVLKGELRKQEKTIEELRKELTNLRYKLEKMEDKKVSEMDMKME